MINTYKRSVVIGVAVLGIVLLAVGKQPASANLLMATDFGASDCSGFFGTGFDSCQIWDDPNDGETIELSPVIIKFNESLEVDGINTLYQAVDGSEFLFSGLTYKPKDDPEDDDEILTGTWTYTPDDLPALGEEFNPALHDPAIKYWAAKGQNDFKLFWVVNDDALLVNGGVCDPSDPFSIPCLNEALIQYTNTWTTPVGYGLSHLTFYDTVPPRRPPEIPSPTPEPATMLLFGTGLVGIASAAKRKKRNRHN